MFQQTIWGRAWVQWMRIVLTVCLLATFASVQAQSNAANYPQKPIKILVGFRLVVYPTLWRGSWHPNSLKTGNNPSLLKTN